MRSKKTDSFINKADKLIMRLVILTAVVLVVVQAMVVDDPFRTVMARVGTDTGAASENNTVHWQDEHITLYLENFSALPHLKVLINGAEFAEFKDRYVTVPVSNEDVLEIDGTFYQHQIIVRVLNITPGVAAPAAGHKLTVNGTVVPVGTVKIKNID